MKVYLAGPMRGLEDWNFPAFDEAEARWKAAGHHVFSPASIARSMGYGCGYKAEPDNGGLDHLKHVMLSDIACLYCSDVIAVLPGWQCSRGSTVEVALCQFLGIPVYCAVKMVELDVVPTPWGMYYDKFGPKVSDGSNCLGSPPKIKYACGCLAVLSDKIKAFCPTHLQPLAGLAREA